MNSAKFESTHEAGEGTRARLSQFGKLLKTAREKTVPSQQEAARRLTEAGYPVSQSLIAQLETGRISNPDASMLRKLSEVYGVSYADLVRGLVLDKYGESDENTSQICELISSEAAAPPEGDPLKAHLMRSKLEFFKHARVLDVDGMAEWQQKIPDLKNYWVIAPDFVDDKIETIRDAVIHNLKRKVTITYFVKAGEEEPGGRFFDYIEELKRYIEDHKELKLKSDRVDDILVVPMESKDIRWLVADMVVANPESPKEQIGFLVFRSEGAPAFGFQMSRKDVAKTVAMIKPFAKQHERKLPNVLQFRKKA
jgi:transcriptional regulator with XRE-family HTH domain